jgi:LuxR family maltose regulon positive regulatory protein
MRRRQIGVIGTGSRPASSDQRLAELRVPSVGAHHVVRPRLHEALDAGLECPVTLIVAPAGAGKTTLVAGWLASSAVPSAWLSLDEADRDVVGLWSRVLDALHLVRPGCSDPARAELRRSGGIVWAVDRIIAELADVQSERRVLVVDDLHEIDDEPLAVATFARFLQHLPIWLHVVVLSRRSPQLPLGRMRVRGAVRGPRRRGGPTGRRLGRQPAARRAGRPGRACPAIDRPRPRRHGRDRGSSAAPRLRLR